MRNWTMRIVLVTALLIMSCGQDSGVTITQKEYGDKWPFTVSEGKLECRGSDQVVFTANGTTYAVNGTAQVTKKYRHIREIWRDDPSLPGAKIDIGIIIERGLELADN